MLLLLISDTHGELTRTKTILQRHTNVDTYLHLGDVGFAISELYHFVVVKGNHDHYKEVKEERILHCEERSILCLHGNQFDEETITEVLQRKDVKDEDMLTTCMQILYDKLSRYAIQKNCDTVFFGHTHIPCHVEYNGIHLINPGTLSYGVEGSSYALVDIHGKDIKVQLYSYDYELINNEFV